MSFKVILWDIDGTLLDFEAVEKVAIRHCFDKVGFGVCTDEMLKTYMKINRGYWQRLERGEISKQEVLVGRFREFFGVVGLNPAVAEEFNAEYQIALGENFVFCEHARDVIEACKKKMPQYAVTNGTKIAQDGKLKNSGLIDVFDEVFISEVVGYEKPAVEFFDKVFETIGEYDRKEVLIVGDSLTSDIRGGNNAGIVTCWYNPKKLPNDAGVTVDYEITDLAQVLELL